MNRKISSTAFLLFLAINLSCCAKPVANQCGQNDTELIQLVATPKKFLNKKINISGEFYSFSTLSLDYKKALRSSKDFIGIILARPDHNEIPLVELKLSAPIAMFKDKNLTIKHGDKISIKGKVYGIELGEPWLEVSEIQIIDKAKDNG